MKEKLNQPEKRLVIPMVRYFNHITTTDLEEIMEWLDDNHFLSEKGIKFRYYFWDFFIRIVKKK